MNILRRFLGLPIATTQNQPNNDNETKINRYWTPQSLHETILLADKFYENKQYMESYEILNRIQYCNYGAIRWRLARLLYHLTYNPNITIPIKNQMINEAYNILADAECDDLAEYHKWYAIVLDTKCGMNSLEERIQHSAIVKEHLMKASQLNPNDFTLQYLLGRWCYMLCTLNRFQILFARYFLAEPPTSSYQEAYGYLLNAEDLKPRTFLPNILLLGKTCMAMKKYHRAKYYFNLIVYLSENGSAESRQARKLLYHLEKNKFKEATYDYTFIG